MDFNSISDQLLISAQVRRLRGSTTWKSDCYNVLYIPGAGLHTKIAGREYSGALLAWYTKEPIQFSAPKDRDIAFLLLRPDGLVSIPATRQLPSEVICLPDSEDADAAGDHLLALCGDCPVLAEAGHLFAILQILTDHTKTKDLLPTPKVPLSDRRISLCRALYTYISANYNRGITQAKTAEDFSITPQYLGRLLKEAYGMTFRQLLAKIREEQRLLFAQYTDLTKEEIEKRLDGESPILTHSEESRTLPGIPGRLRSSHVVKTSPTNTCMSPEGIYVNAIIDPRQHLPNFWSQLVNLGYAADLQKIELGETLARTARDIGFKYGRICRITDLVVPYQAGGQEIYDFSSVFSLLDQLLENGITPFLELGNKSLMIQQTNRITLKSESPEPSDLYYDQLEKILPDFVRACINHYGPENFSRWYFEVSYSYTETAHIKSFGITQYAARFRKICKIIHSYAPDCQVGGPGFNDWNDLSAVRRAFRRLTSSAFQPDFYTVYLYPLVDADGEKMVLSKDPHLFQKRIDLFRQIVQEDNPEVRIWVTETNSNLSARNFLNDSCYQAAWLCRNVLDLLHTGIASFGYYLLSDASLRYRDAGGFLFGGWGLLSDSDFPKPSYHALQLLNRLGPYFIRSSENCLVTADYPGRFQILLVRYMHLKDAALRENVTREALSSPDVVFTDCGSDHCHIRLKGILPGTYLLQEYIISSTHSNLLSTWKNLSYLDLQHTPELSSYVDESRLFVHTVTCTVEDDGIFNLDTELNDNEVRLVTCSLSRERRVPHSVREEGPENEPES
ncbi:MAG: hypothetical protein ACI4OJ_03350 [Lachnospiraceae bacterium]